MAAGSQLENGIWALFVIAAMVMHITCIHDESDNHIFIINQCP
jgi:hypothetical protein